MAACSVDGGSQHSDAAAASGQQHYYVPPVCSFLRAVSNADDQFVSQVTDLQELYMSYGDTCAAVTRALLRIQRGDGSGQSQLVSEDPSLKAAAAADYGAGEADDSNADPHRHSTERKLQLCRAHIRTLEAEREALSEHLADCQKRLRRVQRATALRAQRRAPLIHTTTPWPRRAAAGEASARATTKKIPRLVSPQYPTGVDPKRIFRDR